MTANDGPDPDPGSLGSDRSSSEVVPARLDVGLSSLFDESEPDDKLDTPESSPRSLLITLEPLPALADPDGAGDEPSDEPRDEGLGWSPLSLGESADDRSGARGGVIRHGEGSAAADRHRERRTRRGDHREPTGTSDAAHARVGQHVGRLARPLGVPS